MKAAIFQIQAESGNIEANIGRHLMLARKPIAKGAQLLVFPELSLTGYEPAPAAAMPLSLDDARLAVFQSLSEVAQVTLLVGAPVRLNGNVHIGSFLFSLLDPCNC
mgnify:FL=1